jgi:ribosomal protein S21
MYEEVHAQRYFERPRSKNVTKIKNGTDQNVRESGKETRKKSPN